VLGIQFVVRIQRGNLVAFRQGRIIERRGEKIVQPPTESQHSLPDVDQLGCSSANHMHSEETPVFPMEEHLQEAAVVTEDTVLYLLTSFGWYVGGNVVQCYVKYLEHSCGVIVTPELIALASISI